MAEHGYRSTSMDDIAEAVGISKATLYQHFTSKIDIATAVMIGGVAGFVDWLEHGPERHVTPGEWLVLILREIITMIDHHNSAVFGRTALAMEVFTKMRDRPEYAQISERMLTMLAQAVQAAQASGDVAAEYPPSLVVQMMFNLSETVHYQHLKSEPTETLERVSALIVSAFFNGVQAQGAPSQRVSAGERK